MTHILIVQHGEKRREPGDPDLTARGRLQADATARHIAECCEVSAIVSSPLRRAQETAAAVSRRVGVPIRLEDRLRERMNWNPKLSGQSIEEFLREWELTTNDRMFVPTSGDSSRYAGERFGAAILEHARSLREASTLVVVAHGGVTVDFLRNVLGDDNLRRRSPALIESGVPSCAVTTMAFDGDELTVQKIADVRHLKPEQGSLHSVV